MCLILIFLKIFMNCLDVLESLNIKVLQNSVGSSGSVLSQCPYCGKPKMYMFSEWPHFVKCFANGGHLQTTLAGLFAYIKGINNFEAFEHLRGLLKISSNSKYSKISSNSKKLEEIENFEDFETAEIPEGWKSIKKTDDIPHNLYLKSRGFKWEDIETMKVHWDGSYYGDYVLFPVYEDNCQVSYEKRCIIKEDQWESDFNYRKTQAPPKVKNNNFIYGIDFISYRNTIFLCEGIPNWLSLKHAGFVGGSLFGSSPSKRQIKLLKRLAPIKVVMAFDGDYGGIKAIDKTYKLLKTEIPEVPVDIWTIPDGKDINDLRQRETIRDSFNSRNLENLKMLMGLKIPPKNISKNVKPFSEKTDLLFNKDELWHVF